MHVCVCVFLVFRDGVVIWVETRAITLLTRMHLATRGCVTLAKSEPEYNSLGAKILRSIRLFWYISLGIPTGLKVSRPQWKLWIRPEKSLRFRGGLLLLLALCWRAVTPSSDLNMQLFCHETKTTFPLIAFKSLAVYTTSGRINAWDQVITRF